MRCPRQWHARLCRLPGPKASNNVGLQSSSVRKRCRSVIRSSTGSSRGRLQHRERHAQLRRKGIRSLVRDAVVRYRLDPLRTRFHFIHIPKNAGQSVRDALCLQRDVSLSDPYHYRYVDIADRVGRHLRFFAVVRNPWSWTASRYHYARQRAAKWPIDDPRRSYIERATFADFVRDRRVLPVPGHSGQPWMGPLTAWFNQLEWLRDENGRVACDCLRLERLEEDLQAYLKRRIVLGRRNTSSKGYDYRTMYTNELADAVAHFFRDDIEHFGFTFDGPATNNIFPRTLTRRS